MHFCSVSFTTSNKIIKNCLNFRLLTFDLLTHQIYFQLQSDHKYDRIICKPFGQSLTPLFCRIIYFTDMTSATFKQKFLFLPFYFE